MTRAAELMRSLAGLRWVDEDGNEETLELLPPLSPGEVASLEDELSCALPREARELFAVSRGFEAGPLESVDFSGLGGGAVFDEIFPRGVSIAHDGFGNYWVVDVTPGSDVWGPVFFLCHDPPVVVYQCADAASFLDALVRMTEPPHKGPLDFVHEQAAARIWQGPETALTREAALASADPVLRDFAATLAPGSLVADLRAPAVGEGFSLRRIHAPVRHPTERIVAFQRLPSTAERVAGWLRRLRG